jgi:hypothetical protein
MPRLVEFPLEAGGTLLVETPGESQDGPVTRGLGSAQIAQRVEQAQQTFEDAVARVQPAAQNLIRRLRGLTDAPDEVQVQFGLNLNAEAGAFIAAASGGANFAITLTWRRQQGSDPPADEG